MHVHDRDVDRTVAGFDLGAEFVRAADLVEGHLLAMARGKTGRRYLLSTEFLTLDELLERFAEHVGRPKPRLRVPVPVMKTLSRA